MEKRYYEAIAHFGNEEVDIGVIGILDSRPEVIRDLGHGIRFIHQEGADYLVKIRIGDEETNLDMITISDNRPISHRNSKNYLVLEEITESDANLFGLKKALENFYDEIFGSDNQTI